MQSSLTLKKLLLAAALCQAAASEVGGADARSSRNRAYSRVAGTREHDFFESPEIGVRVTFFGFPGSQQPLLIRYWCWSGRVDNRLWRGHQWTCHGSVRRPMIKCWTKILLSELKLMPCVARVCTA